VVSDERDLVDRFCRGEGAAFTQLVQRHSRAVYGVAYRMVRDHHLADGLAQEAFVRLWKHRERFDPRYPAFPWLKRVVVRLCLDQLRANKKVVSLDVVGEPQDVQQRGPLQEVVGRELHEKVLAAAGRLSDAKREILLLRVVEGLSYQQISARLDCSIGTVMSRLHRARTDMKQSLTGMLEVQGNGQM
jgi:RNA polymerase sigma-70 factor (ECF subfamily)